MKTRNLFKMFLSGIFFLMFFTANADSSCTGGGTMYVCGSEMVVQALQDADNNCKEFSTKKLVDVCSPDMHEYTIYG